MGLFGPTYEHAPRGSGPRGNSFANGPVMPFWARGWEFILLREATVTRWSVEA